MVQKSWLEEIAFEIYRCGLDNLIQNTETNINIPELFKLRDFEDYDHLALYMQWAQNNNYHSVRFTYKTRRGSLELELRRVYHSWNKRKHPSEAIEQVRLSYMDQKLNFETILYFSRNKAYIHSVIDNNTSEADNDKRYCIYLGLSPGTEIDPTNAIIVIENAVKRLYKYIDKRTQKVE